MKLKILMAILLMAFVTPTFTSCSSEGVIFHSKKSKPLPPGQAKKVTGEKSAKKYAPGQQKKKKGEKKS
jgi:hypothetical protein